MPRFLTLPAGVDPTGVFAGLRVLIVGVGAVGRPICEHLARLGVAVLWICDPGRWKSESLLTGGLLDPADVGCSKAESVARLARRISPSTRVHGHDGGIEELEPMLLADVDLVVLATDRLRPEVETGELCMHLGKPLVQASVHGPTLTVQVRFFGNASGDGPCPMCGLGPDERAALDNEIVFSCDGAPQATEGAPTMSTSHLGALAAGLALNQITRHFLGLGKRVADTEIELNGFTLKTNEAPLRRRESCPVDHVAWSVHCVPGCVADLTLREVALEAGMHDRFERAAFRVQGTSWVERAVCRAGHGQLVARFVAAGEPAGSCAQCGGALTSEQFFTYGTAPSSVLTERMDRPLRELCANPPEWVLIQTESDAVVVRSAPLRGDE